MIIYEQSEAFVQEDGDLVFDHTKIILRRNEDEYFYTTTTQRFSASCQIDFSGMELIQIPVDDIWPIYHRKFTQAPDPLPPNTYVKQPSLLCYGDTAASFKLSSQLLNEAEACEILMNHPHSNIAQYRGCIVKDGRIRGLCFTQYPLSLVQRLQQARSLDKNLCLQGIRKGVDHLHELGLIHNDLKPSNIMMDGDNPIIIDFDSCKRVGERLGVKAGTIGWTPADSEYARPENDFFGISKMQEFLDEIDSDKDKPGKLAS